MRLRGGTKAMHRFLLMGYFLQCRSFADFFFRVQSLLVSSACLFFLSDNQSIDSKVLIAMLMALVFCPLSFALVRPCNQPPPGSNSRRVNGGETEREKKTKRKVPALPSNLVHESKIWGGKTERKKGQRQTRSKERKNGQCVLPPLDLDELGWSALFLRLPFPSRSLIPLLFPFPCFSTLLFFPSFLLFFYLSSPLSSFTHRPQRSSFFFFAFFSFLPRVSFSFYSSAVLISSFPSSPLHCLCRSLRQFSFLFPLLSLPRTHTHTYLYNIPLPSSSFAFIRSLLQKNTSQFHTKKERSRTTNHVEDPCRQVPAPTRIVLCRPERTRSRAELGRARHNRPHRCPRQRNLPRRACPVRSLSSDNQPSCLLMPWPLRAAFSWTDQRTMFNPFVVGWHCSLFWTFVLTIHTFRSLFVFFGEQ